MVVEEKTPRAWKLGGSELPVIEAEIGIGGVGVVVGSRTGVAAEVAVAVEVVGVGMGLAAIGGNAIPGDDAVFVPCAMGGVGWRTAPDRVTTGVAVAAVGAEVQPARNTGIQRSIQRNSRTIRTMGHALAQDGAPRVGRSVIGRGSLSQLSLFGRLARPVL